MFTGTAATAVAPSGGFSDVPASNTFYRHIMWLANNDIASGYANGTFGPSDAITRGQMAVFLYKLAGSPSYTPPSKSPFTDVSTSNTFYKHITWLASTGITSGVGDGSRFAPEAKVTRGQMAVFLYKYMSPSGYVTPSSATFGDVPKSHAYFRHISWLADSGVTYGYANGDYGATDSVTRGQMSAFLFKLYHSYAPWAEIKMLAPDSEGYCPVYVTFHNVGDEAMRVRMEWNDLYEGELYYAEWIDDTRPWNGTALVEDLAPAWPGDEITLAQASVDYGDEDWWYIDTLLGSNVTCP